MGVTRSRTEGRGCLRDHPLPAFLLDHNHPTFRFHSWLTRRIIQTVGPSLALKVKTNGYATILSEVAKWPKQRHNKPRTRRDRHVGSAQGAGPMRTRQRRTIAAANRQVCGAFVTSYCKYTRPDTLTRRRRLWLPCRASDDVGPVTTRLTGSSCCVSSDGVFDADAS